MKKYRNASEPLHISAIMEKCFGESQTIPDQAMSTREILHRYTTGQAMSVNSNIPVYAENQPLYDTRRKNNIDIAVDKLNHEAEIMEKESRIFDKTTELQKITRQRQKEQIERLNPQTPQVTPNATKE